MAKNHHSDQRSLIRIGVLSGVTLASGGLFVVGMIQNGNGAVERFNALNAVDKAGGDVDTALNELRSYIYSHMNTEIGGPNGIYPPIQLSGTYERLVATEANRVKDINDNLIVEAKDYCEANGPAGFSGRNRVECINTYVDQNGAKEQTINESFYKYDFVAPRWSPDLAGFSLLVLVISVSVLIVSIISYARTRHFVNIAN